MRKLRIAYIAKEMPVNGISTVILNFCRNLNKDKYDITIFSGAPIAEQYKIECQELGIRLEEMPPKRGGNPLKYYNYLFKNITAKNFDIVHVHGNSATITIEMIMALIRGIKVRIAHCHNTTCDNIKIHELLKKIFRKIYTHGFACSQEAGKWLFGDNQFEVLANGFNITKFKFDSNMREKTRKKLKLEKKLVLGHVGMFNKQKNHEFLLKVFKEVSDYNKNTKLLLVGNGPDFKKIKELIDVHPYKENIICYGESENVEELYAAMDVFVFPSKHEGLGIVLLEAQMNGLTCVTSSVVPDEVKITTNIKKISLESSISLWKDKILEFSNKKIDREKIFLENINEFQKYDIVENTKYLESVYDKIVKK